MSKSLMPVKGTSIRRWARHAQVRDDRHGAIQGDGRRILVKRVGDQTIIEFIEVQIDTPWTVDAVGADLVVNTNIENRIIWHGHGVFSFAGGPATLTGGSASNPQRVYAAMLWESPNTISLEVSNTDVESDPISTNGGRWRGLIATGYKTSEGNAIQISEEHRGAFHVYTLA
jgi:hypothetical protein